MGNTFSHICGDKQSTSNNGSVNKEEHIAQEKVSKKETKENANAYLILEEEETNSQVSHEIAESPPDEKTFATSSVSDSRVSNCEVDIGKVKLVTLCGSTVTISCRDNPRTESHVSHMNIGKVETLILTSNVTSINEIELHDIIDPQVLQAENNILVASIKWKTEELERKLSNMEEEKRLAEYKVEEEKRERTREQEAMNHQHTQKLREEHMKVMSFVINLEERDIILAGFIRRLVTDKQPFVDVVESLKRKFNIRLMAVDCGLNFILDAPDSQWSEVVERKLEVQQVLSDLLPEEQRERVNWQEVSSVNIRDVDLKLGCLSPVKEDAHLQADTTTNSVSSALDIFWLEHMQQWYPNLAEMIYFLPPLQTANTTQDKLFIGNKSLSTQRDDDENHCLTPISDYERLFIQPQHYLGSNLSSCPADLREVHKDKCLQMVLQKFHSMAENSHPKEIMMIISQMNFGQHSYMPYYTDASELPRTKVEEGDFHFLIIHRHYGLIATLIKTVDVDFSKLDRKQQEAVVLEKVRDGISQLTSVGEVLKASVSDLGRVNIGRALIMPNVQSSQMSRVIKGNEQTAKELCQCLGAGNVTEALDLCLCDKDEDDVELVTLPSEEIPGNDVVVELSSNQSARTAHEVEDMREFRHWFDRVLSVTPGPNLTEDIYRQLTARFCGLASTVNIYCCIRPRLAVKTETASEEVLMMNKLALLVLSPEQVDILSSSPPRILLTGPPGTGKTLVLVLQGISWLQQGFNVEVVNIWRESYQACIIVEHQLKQTMMQLHLEVLGQVRRHVYDFRNEEDIEEAIRFLGGQEGKLHILIDDAHPYIYSSGISNRFKEFCDRIIKAAPTICLWAAAVSHTNRPLSLHEFKLTTPFRFPPTVLRELTNAEEILDVEVHGYTVNDTFDDTAAKATGPRVLRITHDSNHSVVDSWPDDCPDCGKEIAQVLKDLHVGETGNGSATPLVQYRDVLVLCYNPSEKRKNSKGHLTRASGLVEGLRDCHVPVQVVEQGSYEDAFQDIVLSVKDEVMVTSWSHARGLERKVVFVAALGDVFYRLYGVSRCSSQLVWIDWRQPSDDVAQQVSVEDLSEIDHL